MIEFSNKTFKENFSDPEASYNGVVEYTETGIITVSIWGLQSGTSIGSANLDSIGTTNLSGFKPEDLEGAAVKAAAIFTAIKTHAEV